MSPFSIAEVMRRLRKSIRKPLRKSCGGLRKSGCKSLFSFAEVMRRFAEVYPSPYGGEGAGAPLTPHGVGRRLAA